MVWDDAGRLKAVSFVHFFNFCLAFLFYSIEDLWPQHNTVFPIPV